MNKQNNGGPAFPFESKIKRALPNNQIVVDGPYSGMSLRDYFAAKAMQGLITKHGFIEGDLGLAASSSYAVADAMLAARERQS